MPPAAFMMSKNSSNVIVKATNVTVSPTLQSARRQVFATCVPTRPAHAQQVLVESQPIIKKVLLKAVSKQSKGKEPKIFTLRDVSPHKVSCCSDMKSLIKAQLSDDITDDEFDLGYLQGNTVVNIRSRADLEEIWEGLKKGLNITFWCDGLQVEQQSSSRKRPVSVDSHDAQGSKKRKQKKDDTSTKDDKVEEVIHKLQESHGKEFTQMQYRIWAEMHVGGVSSYSR